MGKWIDDKFYDLKLGDSFETLSLSKHSRKSILECSRRYRQLYDNSFKIKTKIIGQTIIVTRIN